jgi:hypothetical protein
MLSAGGVATVVLSAGGVAAVVLSPTTTVALSAGGLGETSGVVATAVGGGLAAVSAGGVAAVVLSTTTGLSGGGEVSGVVATVSAGGVAAVVLSTTTVVGSCLSCLAATGDATRHSRTLAAMHRVIARMIATRLFQIRPARRCTAARLVICCSSTHEINARNRAATVLEALYQRIGLS